MLHTLLSRMHCRSFYGQPMFPLLTDCPGSILSGIVIATTVDVVAFTHVSRERNLSRLVDITGKAGLPSAPRTDGLAARFVFLKMESIFVHNVVGYVFLQMNTTICSLQFLQSCRNFPFSVLETAKLQRLQAATRDHPLQFRGDDSLLFSLDFPDLSYMIFS